MTKSLEAFSDSNTPLLANDYLTTLMSLINAIITTPSDLDTRIQLRDEFYHLGLIPETISQLKVIATTSFNVQLELFLNEVREDVVQGEIIFSRSANDANKVEETMSHESQQISENLSLDTYLDTYLDTSISPPPSPADLQDHQSKSSQPNLRDSIDDSSDNTSTPKDDGESNDMRIRQLQSGIHSLTEQVAG